MYCSARVRVLYLLLFLGRRWGRRHGLELVRSFRGSSIADLLPRRECVEVPVGSNNGGSACEQLRTKNPMHAPESLSELEGLVDDALPLLVVAYLSITLLRQMKHKLMLFSKKPSRRGGTSNRKLIRTVNGKSLRSGCPSKPGQRDDKDSQMRTVHRVASRFRSRTVISEDAAAAVMQVICQATCIWRE